MARLLVEHERDLHDEPQQDHQARQRRHQPRGRQADRHALPGEGHAGQHRFAAGDPLRGRHDGRPVYQPRAAHRRQRQHLRRSGHQQGRTDDHRTPQGGQSDAQGQHRLEQQLRMEGHQPQRHARGPSGRFGRLEHRGVPRLLRRLGTFGRRARRRRRPGEQRHGGRQELLPDHRRGHGRRSLLHLRRHECPAARALAGLHAAQALVRRQTVDDRLARGPQPVDDLQQGALRSRTDHLDHQQLPAGRGLLHAAQPAEHRIHREVTILKPRPK